MTSILSSLFGNHNDIHHLDSDSFEKMMEEEKNFILIDVRTFEENKSLRIPNSKHIDIYKPNFADQIEKLNRSKPYFVYCRAGRRSHSACRQMKGMGFEKVYNLKGGINNWRGKTEQG